MKLPIAKNVALTVPIVKALINAPTALQDTTSETTTVLYKLLLTFPPVLPPVFPATQAANAPAPTITEPNSFANPASALLSTTPQPPKNNVLPAPLTVSTAIKRILARFAKINMS